MIQDQGAKKLLRGCKEDDFEILITSVLAIHDTLWPPGRNGQPSDWNREKCEVIANILEMLVDRMEAEPP